MNTNFPENLFNISQDNISNYEYIIQVGKDIAKNKSILFCGICRNVEDILQLNIDRLNRTGSLFKKYNIFVYENDSHDGTLEILKKNKLINQHFDFLHDSREDKNYAEKLDTPDDPWHYNRCCVLAECRNKYMEYLNNLANKPDYVCVFDFDIKGGWSYNGFYHSIFVLEHDKKHGCVSAYGVLADPKSTQIPLEHKKPSDYLMYDSFAFRPHDWNSAINMISTPLFNNVKVDKNMPPFLVESNFGGMAIYKTAAFLDGKQYSARNFMEEKNSPYVDPDHVCLHRTMRKNGWKILLNPAFIVSYSHHKFSNMQEKKYANHVTN